MSQSSNTRRRGLAAVVTAAMVVALSGCAIGGSTADADDNVLTVATWKGYGADLTWAVEQFEEETGATVQFQYIDSLANLLELLKNSEAIDVALPNIQYIVDGIDEGLFHELDTSRLENWDDIASTFRDLPQIAAGDEVYGLPWTWGSTGIVYNTEVFAEAPSSLSVLWDPQYQGQVAVKDDVTVLVPTAALYTGDDPQTPDLTTVEPALTELRDQAKMIYASSADLALSLSNSTVAVGIANSGIVNYFDPAVQSQYAYTIPEEGAVGWIDTWTISAKSKNVDLAYEWLNYMTGPEYLTKWINTPEDSPAAVTNQVVIDSLDPAVVASLDADLSVIGRLAFQLPQPAAELQSWTDTWQAVKSK